VWVAAAPAATDWWCRGTPRSQARRPDHWGRPNRRHASGQACSTDEEIQIVFDRYKASFYRLYNRELRNNPP